MKKIKTYPKVQDTVQITLTPVKKNTNTEAKNDKKSS